MRSKRPQKGFTLVEMVVAAAMLIIGATAALSAISATLSGTRISSEYATAALLANQKLSDVESQLDTLSAGEQQGDFQSPYQEYHWAQNTESTDVTALYKVTITITWTSGISSRQSQFVSYEINATQISQ